MHLRAGRIKVDAGFCGQNPGPRIFEQGSCNLHNIYRWKIPKSLFSLCTFQGSSNYQLRKTFNSYLNFSTTMSRYCVVFWWELGGFRLKSLNMQVLLRSGSTFSPSMTISSPFHSCKVKLGPLVRVIHNCQKPSQPVLGCLIIAFDKEDRLAGRILTFLHAVTSSNEMQGELGGKLYMMRRS
jgi:hypothetical protein